MKILSKLKLLFTPTDEWDAVNKKYVDRLISSKGEIEGVKGEAETEYRKGFVNISPKNIGTYSKEEIDDFINNLQNIINTFTDKVTIIERMIESGEIITTVDKITDNNGNVITTNLGDILMLNYNNTQNE